MRTERAGICVVLALALLIPAGAQPPPAATPTAPGDPAMAEEADPIAMMRQMGADEGDIVILHLLSQAAGVDLGQAMMLFMLADQGQINDDILGMLLFSKALAGGGGKQPAALLAGGALLVVEDGTVYRIDVGKMEVTGSVSYRPSAAKTGLPAEVMRMLRGAQEKAQVAGCTSNVRQLCTAALMYGQDHGNAFPNENWVEDLRRYIPIEGVFGCPGRPDKRVAYALNEALAGAAIGDVKDPSNTVLFFEADLPDDVPFGGADAVLQQPRHGDLIVAGFVDGHCKAMSPDDLRQLLERNPFE